MLIKEKASVKMCRRENRYASRAELISITFRQRRVKS